MRISDWSSDVCSSDLWRTSQLPQGRNSPVKLPSLRSSRAYAHLYGRPAINRIGFGEARLLAAAFAGRRSEYHSVDRKSVVSGKSVSVRVDLGGRRSIQKNNTSTIGTRLPTK